MSFLNVLFGNTSASDKISILDKQEYAKTIAGANVQLVDVRTAREYAAGHIKGATNIDFFRSSVFETAFDRLDRSKPVYIYCQSGNRSQKAARRLLGMGFEEIYDLKGGYVAWRR